MSQVDVVTETVIDRPRAVVADYASDPENAPHWYVNIKTADLRTPPPVGKGSKIAFAARFLGKRMEYTYEVIEFVAGERVVMATDEGPFPMETTYTWESVGGAATRMTLRNRGRPSGFAAFMTPFMSVMMKRANRKDLARLKEVLEASPGPDAKSGTAT